MRDADRFLFDMAVKMIMVASPQSTRGELSTRLSLASGVILRVPAQASLGVRHSRLPMPLPCGVLGNRKHEQRALLGITSIGNERKNRLSVVGF